MVLPCHTRGTLWYSPAIREAHYGTPLPYERHTMVLPWPYERHTMVLPCHTRQFQMKALPVGLVSRRGFQVLVQHFHLLLVRRQTQRPGYLL